MTENEVRQKYIAQAKSWMGYSESNGKYREIIDVYNSIKPLPVGYYMKYSDPWCATFVSACAWKVGLTDIIFPECSCDRMISLYKNHNRWEENDAYVPTPGDIIFYDWDDSGVGDNIGFSDHVGIVTAVSNNVMTIIEGNNSNNVLDRKLQVNSRYIRGFGLPNYASKATQEQQQEPQQQSGKTTETMSDMDIFKALISGGLSNAGAAAVMGNLYYESGLKANNMENAYEGKYNDITYTAAVDNGTYTNFVHDAIGYGLAQWTYYSRKQNLLNYANSINASIGSPKMQIAFLLQELAQSFPALLTQLKVTPSVTAASNMFMQQFENPADQSSAALARRAEKSQEYYNKYTSTTVTPEPVPTPTPTPTPVDESTFIKRGMTGDKVSKLQLHLTLLRYPVGMCGIDGEFGNDTYGAVKSFQRAYNLEVDGIVGPETNGAIESALKTLKPPTAIYTWGDRNSEVQIMATLLKYLKYFNAACTVVCSYVLYMSIKKFQGDHGLEVDGECGPLTWAKLYEEARK